MIKRFLVLLALLGLMTGRLAISPVDAAPTAKSGMMKMVMLHQLHHSHVTGTAVLTYSSTTKMTTVTLTVRHLKPGSVHPDHIHAGTCSKTGRILIGFPLLKANSKGVARVTKKFKGSFAHKKWSINVHRGPTLAGAQATPIACGNI